MERTTIGLSFEVDGVIPAGGGGPIYPRWSATAGSFLNAYNAMSSVNANSMTPKYMYV